MRLTTAMLMALAQAALGAAAESQRTGPMQLTFTERSPLSPMVQIAQRKAFKMFARGAEHFEYDLAAESFEAFVPTNYKPDAAWGVFVFVSAGGAQLTPGWGEVFARRKLIWICANNTGNGRDARIRIALALDAVHNLKKTYVIADDRVYIAGFSGGAFVATMVMTGYPDVFHGGFIMGGGALYELQAHRGEQIESTLIGPQWEAPIDQLKKEMRLAFIVGQGDEFGKPLARVNYEAMILDGFQRVSYFEMPRVGHAHPEPIVLDKAILAIEQPNPKIPPTTKPTTQPHPQLGQIAQARRMLKTAEYWIDRDKFTLARRYAQQIIDDYPTTPSARDASTLLQRLSNPSEKRR